MIELSDKEFKDIRGYIKQNYGINLSDEKKSLVYSRLKTTVQELNFSSFGDYFDYMKKDKTGRASDNFVDRITTNHTFFMREQEHFDYLFNKVFPYIEERYEKTKDVRIWSAACSSGEEAYTIQILLKEYFQYKPDWNIQILATDISKSVLQKAYDGIYSNNSLANLPKEWRTKYFKPYDEDHCVAVDSLRNNIVYRYFNLMDEDFQFKRDFQVIFCRNVMIYFDSDTRHRLVDKLYDVTEEGGYLFIGHSESLNHTDTPYKYIMPAVYRKLEKEGSQETAKGARHRYHGK